MSVQATRRPTAAQRAWAARAQSERRTVARIILLAVLAQALTLGWHVMYAEDAEKAIWQLHQQLDQVNDELREAQLHQARFYGPQD